MRFLPWLYILGACNSAAPAETRDNPPADTKPVVPWTFDPATTLAKLEGAWVVRGFGSSDGTAAWRFAQGKLTIYDPKTKQEKVDRLELWSPCKAHLASGYGGTLVVDGDDIFLGLGDGGVRYGDTIIACMGSGTVYATPKGCATYEVRFGDVKIIPTRCALPDGRFTTLEGGSEHRKSSLRFWSDRLLLSDQLAGSRLEKQPSWDAAKTAAEKPAIATKWAPSRAANNPSPAKTPEPTFPSPPPPEPKPDVPWSGDQAAAVAKLQGVWLVKGFGSYGAVSAWKIDGAKVTVYSPSTQTETPDVLLFDSPCDVRLDSGHGGTLVIDGDTVYLGLGYGGLKQGDTIVACMGSGTVVATKAGCTTYHEDFGKWSKVETACKEAGGQFVATEKSGESSLRFVNDHLLLTDQLAASKLAKQSDWAAAKTAADALHRKPR